MAIMVTPYRVLCNPQHFWAILDTPGESMAHGMVYGAQSMGPTKIELLLLDPDTRAFTLVGAFLGFFALLEAGVNEAIGEIMQIDPVRRTIVGRNMGFDEKIKTLRVLVDLYVQDPEDKKSFDKLAVQARQFAEQRNILAHTPFRRSPVTDGVEFFVVAASKKLQFPDLDWSVDDFITKIEGINTLDNELRSIEKKMSLQRIAEALTADIQQTPTKGGLFGLLLSTGGAIDDAEELGDL
jgi:hypothetical protein